MKMLSIYISDEQLAELNKRYCTDMLYSDYKGSWQDYLRYRLLSATPKEEVGVING